MERGVAQRVIRGWDLGDCDSFFDTFSSGVCLALVLVYYAMAFYSACALLVVILTLVMLCVKVMKSMNSEGLNFAECCLLADSVPCGHQSFDERGYDVLDTRVVVKFRAVNS